MQKNHDEQNLEGNIPSHLCIKTGWKHHFWCWNQMTKKKFCLEGGIKLRGDRPRSMCWRKQGTHSWLTVKGKGFQTDYWHVHLRTHFTLGSTEPSPQLPTSVSSGLELRGRWRGHLAFSAFKAIYTDFFGIIDRPLCLRGLGWIFKWIFRQEDKRLL